jgi:hypothetical protein
MRHGNMERHLVTRRDPGMETCLFSSLLRDKLERVFTLTHEYMRDMHTS